MIPLIAGNFTGIADVSSALCRVSTGCGRDARGPGGVINSGQSLQLHPLVPPQVLHFMQVPLRTRVKLPHEPQASPS